MISELQYWVKRTRNDGALLYELKPEYMAPPIFGKPPRHFNVLMNTFPDKGHRVLVTQDCSPSNPTIPMLAWLELCTDSVNNFIEYEGAIVQAPIDETDTGRMDAWNEATGHFDGD